MIFKAAMSGGFFVQSGIDASAFLCYGSLIMSDFILSISVPIIVFLAGLFVLIIGCFKKTTKSHAAKKIDYNYEIYQPKVKNVGNNYSETYLAKEYQIYTYNGIDFDQYVLLRNEIINLPEYYAWRESVLARSSFRCQSCGIKRIYNLEVHHRRSLYNIIISNRIASLAEAKNCAELWDIANGEALCSSCHRFTDSYKQFNGQHNNQYA